MFASSENRRWESASDSKLWRVRRNSQLCLAAFILTLSGNLNTSLKAVESGPTNTASAQRVPTGMVLIPDGVYRPLFRAPGEPKQVPVRAFYLDAFPVRNGDFLDFVRANPAWRRSSVKRIFADESYLKSWAGDLELGSAASNAPVTSVSWFAAKAYAKWKGKRLPTLAEWEYAAQASPTRADGENDPAFRAEVLRWYTTPNGEVRNAGAGKPNYWGVHDLHGLIWEWVLDYNSAMLTGDSRADGSAERGFFCGGGSQGSTDTGDYPAFMRFGFRTSLHASYCIHNLGFRCANDIKEKGKNL